MEKRTAKVYVLAGVWNHEDYDGTEVIDVSEDFEKLHEKIEEIKENFAADYLPRTQGNLTEEKGERYYEVTDENGAYAKFYITEHYIDSESIKSGFDSDCESCKGNRADAFMCAKAIFRNAWNITTTVLFNKTNRRLKCSYFKWRGLHEKYFD